jgi:hypothetical protein
MSKPGYLDYIFPSQIDKLSRIHWKSVKDMTYLLKWERNDMGCGDYLRAVFSAENADVQLAREALEAFAWRHEASSYHNAVVSNTLVSL